MESQLQILGTLMKRASVLGLAKINGWLHLNLVDAFIYLHQMIVRL
jgi:hypothetical protein